MLYIKSKICANNIILTMYLCHCDTRPQMLSRFAIRTLLESHSPILYYCTKILDCGNIDSIGSCYWYPMGILIGYPDTVAQY